MSNNSAIEGRCHGSNLMTGQPYAGPARPTPPGRRCGRSGRRPRRRTARRRSARRPTRGWGPPRIGRHRPASEHDRRLERIEIEERLELTCHVRAERPSLGPQHLLRGRPQCVPPVVAQDVTVDPLAQRQRVVVTRQRHRELVGVGAAPEVPRHHRRFPQPEGEEQFGHLGGGEHGDRPAGALAHDDRRRVPEDRDQIVGVYLEAAGERSVAVPRRVDRLAVAAPVVHGDG